MSDNIAPNETSKNTREIEKKCQKLHKTNDWAWACTKDTPWRERKKTQKTATYKFKWRIANLSNFYDFLFAFFIHSFWLVIARTRLIVATEWQKRHLNPRSLSFSLPINYPRMATAVFKLLKTANIISGYGNAWVAAIWNFQAIWIVMLTFATPIRTLIFYTLKRKNEHTTDSNKKQANKGRESDERGKIIIITKFEFRFLFRSIHASYKFKLICSVPEFPFVI